ncbi:hypothetical protein C6A25_07245 [Streptococcus anginosus]|uniref:hypothetical protein n=1 Tax=Streptococcus anginosus TaxID=1328 RepID=UPI000D02BCF8|nr:hypothetical protein [Streptococcus anginosus]PRT74735.1 hypothetical protein C6A25_07245 [Streptococcus anginosus]
MTRKKLISDDELIHLFEQYLISQCSCDLSLVKIPRFGDYVRNHGYQNVADTTIRRNKRFREFLKESEIKYQDENYEAVITYKTIDVENFMAKNRDPEAMKRALVEISQYYKKIANIAASYKQEADKLRGLNFELQSTNEDLKQKLQRENELIDENQKLLQIIKTSVYPEIANELLKEEGLLKNSQKVISENFLADNIVTADSEIDFHSSGLIEQENPQKSTKVVSIKNLLDSKTNYK